MSIDPDVAASMANLASTYRNQGRRKEAEELPRRCFPPSRSRRRSLASSSARCGRRRRWQMPDPSQVLGRGKLVWLPQAKLKQRFNQLICRDQSIRPMRSPGRATQKRPDNLSMTSQLGSLSRSEFRRITRSIERRSGSIMRRK